MNSFFKKIFLIFYLCTMLGTPVSAENSLHSPDYSKQIIYPYILLNYWSLYGELNQDTIGEYTRSLMVELGLPVTSKQAKKLKELLDASGREVEFAENVIKKYFE